MGLVVGACLAENGNTVVCVDKDDAKIQMLQSGKIPIYEPGLEELVRRNHAEQRLTFATDLTAAVYASEIAFIAVGTPEAEDGSADLQHVLAVARDVGRAMNKYMVVVDKSTVPVGTAAKGRSGDHPSLQRRQQPRVHEARRRARGFHETGPSGRRHRTWR